MPLLEDDEALSELAAAAADASEKANGELLLEDNEALAAAAADAAEKVNGELLLEDDEAMSEPTTPDESEKTRGRLLLEADGVLHEMAAEAADESAEASGELVLATAAALSALSAADATAAADTTLAKSVTPASCAICKISLSVGGGTTSEQANPAVMDGAPTVLMTRAAASRMRRSKCELGGVFHKGVSMRPLLEHEPQGLWGGGRSR